MNKDSEKGKYRSPEGSATWEYIATMSCSLMIFCVGCLAGWNSPTLDILMEPDSPIPLVASDASTLASMAALGHAVAPALTVVMARKLGRKNSLLVTGIPTLINWGLIAVAKDVMVLFIARFIAGLSLGLILCLPQMYLGEIASPKLRGALGMVCGTMINFGILFMFVIVPLLSVSTTAYISLSIVTVATIGIWFIPESPYFLAMIGKMEEAEDALEKLRGKTDVTEELELIKLTISQKGKSTADSSEGNKPEPSALSQLFKVRGNRKALFINFLFVLSLQFGSYITFMIYGHIIFKKMRAPLSGHVCTMIVAILQIVCNIPTAFVIDKLGRRPLVCISGVISGFCLLAIAVYLYVMEYTKVDISPYSTYAMCAIFLNIIALNIGLVPLQHVVQSEILDTQVKGLATCIVGVGGGVLATIGIKCYLMSAETWNFGHAIPMFFYCISTWTYTAIILKLLPETKGKTLFEIQQDLNA